MTDSFDLQRFVDAQAAVYSRVIEELRRGRKQSHWMWFIFPQIAGLGLSEIAQRFAISSREEALDYLAHLLLGSRLRKCTALVGSRPKDAGTAVRVGHWPTITSRQPTR
jgi:uncharacterized protein (DUF1810 family)